MKPELNNESENGAVGSELTAGLGGESDTTISMAHYRYLVLARDRYRETLKKIHNIATYGVDSGKWLDPYVIHTLTSATLDQE